MRHLSLILSAFVIFFANTTLAQEKANTEWAQGKPFYLVEDFPANSEQDPVFPNPGNLKMYLHVPADMPASAPVVVVLHGCMKGAEQIMSWTGWNDLADKHKFYVIYPQQQKPQVWNNIRTGNVGLCFSWSGRNGKWKAIGHGEDRSIVDMIGYLKTKGHGIDEKRIFVTGFSAGGAMTNLMLAHYPDVFAGGAPLAGVPYRCADTLKQGFDCMGVKPSFLTRSNNGPGCEGLGEACMDPERKKTPEQWREMVTSHGKPGFDGAYPRVFIWHGGRDKYVDDDNLQEQMKQWTAVHGLDQKADNASTTLKETYADHIYSEYQDKGGNVKVATLIIPRMFHAVPVEPGEGKDQGGKEAGNHAVDYGLYSSYYIARFWGIVD
ncbi:MAG: hypothetical protein D6B28_03310 [Gammaproteobacteria bacterium]|nr:MAG: hypothetical protein D6B28_03310 [Gammaproteobacteria bacterium]